MINCKQILSENMKDIHYSAITSFKNNMGDDLATKLYITRLKRNIIHHGTTKLITIII